MSLEALAVQNNTEADSATKTPEVPVADKLYDKTVEAPKTADTEGKKEEVVEQKTTTQQETPKAMELKLPEGSLLKSAEVEKIAQIAKERGFSNEQAQLLLNEKDAAVREFADSQQKDIKQKIEVEWVKEIQNDKEMGGANYGKTVETAKRVIQRFDPDGSFSKVLDSTGLGNHPGLVKVLARIGAQMSDDQFIKAPAVDKKNKSLVERIYGKE